MKRHGKTNLMLGGLSLAAFGLWTVLIQWVDVKPIGPEGSAVGFAAVNGWFHRLTGVHWELYTLTDWLGLVPIFICMGFGLLGLAQLIKRRSLFRVDADLLLLGGYYLMVIFCYLFFEMVPINRRPVLIEGRLEASYPSSTALLVLSVLPTLKLQVDRRAESLRFKMRNTVFTVGFTAFMAAGRLISGVHWITDILGSVLLSAGLFLLYRGAVLAIDENHPNS